jgi:hypothetical protein
MTADHQFALISHAALAECSMIDAREDLTRSGGLQTLVSA